MNNRSGLSFADVLILLAIVLLLAALAVPKFVKATDYGNEEDEIAGQNDTAASSSQQTNTVDSTNVNASAKETP